MALEALLVAVLIWVAAMTLAGETGSGLIAGSADAGRGSAPLSVVPSAPGASVTLSANTSEAGTWIQLICRHSGSVVLARWTSIATNHRATFSLADNSSSDASLSCTAQDGYFSANCRWRVLAETTFTVAR